jgi:hypothetical protein
MSENIRFIVCTDGSEDLFTLKMEPIQSSEMSVHTRSTRRHTTEDGIPHDGEVFVLFDAENVPSKVRKV